MAGTLPVRERGAHRPLRRRCAFVPSEARSSGSLGGGGTGMRKTVWLVSTFAITIAIAVPALAHPTTSFDSCAAYRGHGGYCGDSASYTYGDRVFLRASVV